jgi:hypothetical protein
MKKTGRPAADLLIKHRNARTSVRSRARDFLNTTTVNGATQGIAVKEFCDTYRVAQDTFSRLSGFSPRAVAHWVRGRKPSGSTERRLTEMKRFFQALEHLVPPESIGPWLKAPNPAFDGSTPLQVIERGETDRIWRMIYELESGEPG